MKASLVCLLGAMLIAGAMAQDSAACDPSTAGVDLVDLTTQIGELACKVPASVNLTAVMGSLTGLLTELTLDQLKGLPALMEATIAVDPAVLEPFFSLSATQLDRLVPLLSGVKASTLATVFPLLADQPEGTVDKMIKFLNGISRAKLEQLEPLFGRITEGQVNVMVHALTTLPEPALMKLTALIQALGPVTDSVVSAKQTAGFLPNYSTSSSNTPRTNSSTATTTSTTSTASTQSNTITIRPGLPFLKFSGRKGAAFGRKMLQQSDEDKAAEALAAAALAEAAAAPPAAEAAPAPSGACIPDQAGVEIGIPLLGDFGVVVCKFTADALRPVLSEMIAIMLKQSNETLANLPQFTQLLTSVKPETLQVFFKIPTASLRELIPVLSKLNPQTVGVQLATIGSQQPSTIDNMVFFLQNTPESQVKILVPLFSRLNDAQLDTSVKLVNALSPGQITLAIHLLETFGFAVDAIGRKIPQSSNRGNTFMIGPVRVTVGGSSSTSSRQGFFGRHPIFGGFLGRH